MKYVVIRDKESKMKNIICLLTVVLLIIAFVGCSKDTKGSQKDDSKSTTSSTNSEQDDNNHNEITVEDVENAAVTEMSKFNYREVEDGIAITSYNGEDEIVVIPDTIDGKKVVSIDNNSFVNNKTMLGLRLADSIINIGSNAFENCTSLKVFVSGTSLMDISEFAFNGCKELRNVKLNEGLKSLGMLSFGATNMSELYIPESVETIDMPFTANEGKALKIISTSGSEAENYVSMDGENFNLTFEAK